MEFKQECEILRNLPLDIKVKKSIEILKDIKQKLDEDLPLIINFSGGKDSMACLTLALKVFPKNRIWCCYADGGFELPQTLEYVKSKAKEVGVELHIAKAGEVTLSHRPTGPLTRCQTFEDFILHYKYWPSAGKRWCSTWMKQRLMKAYWRQLFGPKVKLFKVNGVRQFESKTRLWKYGDPKHYMKHVVDGNKFIRYDREHNPTQLVYPILEWTTEDVIQFLKNENIVLHSGYKVFGVSGCKWCPVHTPDIYENILRLHPNMYDDIIELETKIGKPAVRGEIFLKDIKEKVLNERLQNTQRQ